MNANDIKKELYEDYKREWMRENISERTKNAVYEEWKANYDESVWESFEEYREEIPYDSYIEENGYHGMLYVCYDEFLDYEYQDLDWLTTHLASDEAAILANEDEDFSEEFKDDTIWWCDNKAIANVSGRWIPEKLSPLEQTVRNAIQAARRDGYNQVVFQEANGDYGFMRYLGNDFENAEKIIGLTEISYVNGILNASFHENDEPDKGRTVCNNRNKSNMEIE